jgi:hypothetical protein
MKLRNAVVSSLVLAVSTFAVHAQTKEIRTGVTKVDLAEGFLSALSSLHVTPAPLGASELRDTTIDFPILAGQFDTSDNKAEIIHSGGLSLTAGGTVVALRDFIIDTTGPKPIITGLVVLDGKVVGRLTLFDLSLKGAALDNDRCILIIKNVDVTLDSGAAATLNSVFKISALAGGINIGTAEVFAVHSGK